MSLSEEETIERNNNLPHIYVNNDILKPIVVDLSRDVKKQPIYNRVYEINGVTFREDVSNDNGTLSAFEIQTTNTSDGETEVKIRETADKYLRVSIQETPYGVIINSNVLLSIDQWNTIVKNNDIHTCLVCDTVICGVTDHVDSIVHIQNLEKYQPLKIYDLSITRLIDDVYHCGVCNEPFDRHEDVTHFDSKCHEDRMLFATNRASDVMFDFDIHDYRPNDNTKSEAANKNADCYHFDRNRILSVSEESSGFNSADGFYDYDVDIDNNVVYLSDNDTDNIDIADNTGTEFDAEPNEYSDPSYISYASMAKVAAAPEYLYVTIFDKKMKMKFDHWHMLSAFKSGQLWCMVCQNYCQATQKAQHCAQKTHLERLARYEFVDDHKTCFVRKVDYKYYHCGICNNLQVVSDLDEHIKSRHKKRVIKALHSEVVPKKTKNNEWNTKNNGTEKTGTVAFPLNFKGPQSTTLQPINSIQNIPIVTDLVNTNNDTVSDSHKENTDTVIDRNDNKTAEATPTDYEELIRNYYSTNLRRNTVTHNELTGINVAGTNNDENTVIDKNNDEANVIDKNNDEGNVIDKNNDKAVTPAGNAENFGNITVIEKNNDIKPVTAEVNTDVTCETVTEENNDEKTVIATANLNIDNSTNDCHSIGNNKESPSIDINSHIIIEQFGFSFKLQCMSYNFVSKIESNYYCHICDITACDSEMTSHIRESDHVEKLKSKPFDNIYGINLIRLHGFQNHCAICNEIFNTDFTRDHIAGRNHITMITNSLSVIPKNKQAAIRMNKPTSDMNQAAISMNRPTSDMNQAATTSGINKPSMGMYNMTMHLPTSGMNQAVIDMNQLPMNQTASGINQAAISKNPPISGFNTSGINQPAMGMNHTTMHLPTSGMNQASIGINQLPMNLTASNMNRAAMGMNQVPMQQPTFAVFQRPPPFLQTMPTNQPIMAMNQWPALPPTKGFQFKPLGLNQNTKNQHQNTHPFKIIPKQTLNLTTIDLNKPVFKQEIMGMNQRKNSLPNLNMDKPKIESHQFTMNLPVNDKNQHNTVEPKTDVNQSTVTNQRATIQPKQKKIDSKLESVEDMLDLDESVDDEDDAYDADNIIEDCEYFDEKFVILKLKNTYLKVGLASYNSLIKIGDGSSYCFVCSARIYGSLKKHVESKNHTNCMDECKFVNKYDRHLLRQMFLNYHCSICNTVFTRKDINKHITWPMHLQDNKTCKTDKKTRRTNLKLGSKLQDAKFQSEAIYLNEKEPEMRALLQIEVIRDGQNVEDILQKKNKIIIFQEKVLKISWDAYHGLCKTRSAYRCMLCQRDVRSYELGAHIRSARHLEPLDNFQTQHLPHLIRQIDESIVNCVICNAEVANTAHVVTDHVTGKRHRKLHDAILDHSRTADSYADCADDVLHLCGA